MIKILYKPNWDHPVTISRATCVHGGLWHLPASNLIAVTKSSGAYNSLLPQKFGLHYACMWILALDSPYLS